MVDDAVKKYDSIFEEMLMFIAKGEADVYIKMISGNEDSYGEKEGKRLRENLNKAEEELENILSIYKRININEDKIIKRLELVIQEHDIRKKEIDKQVR